MKKILETIVLGVSIVRAVLCLLGCIFTVWLACSFAEVVVHNDDPNYDYSSKNAFVVFSELLEK